jgi:uncharacterized protein Yka (UPF0111/DUF47 family)
MSKLYQDVLADAITHVEKVVLANREMVGALDAWLKEDFKELAEHRRQTEHLEEQANAVRTRLLATIATAETESKRSDLLQLMLDADALADQAEGITHRLSLITYHPRKEIRDQFHDIALVTLKGVEFVKDALEALNKRDFTGALAFAKKVHLQKNTAVEIFIALEAQIFTSLDVDVRVSTQVRNIAVRFEQINQRAKEVADEIRVIASSKQ